MKQTQLPPWLTEDIQRAMRNRDQLKKDKKFGEYKKQRNKVKYLVRSAKKAYFNKLIENNRDTATLWRAINTIIKGKMAPQIPDHLTADEFNEHFMTSAETLAQSAMNEVSSEYQIPKVLSVPLKTQLKSLMFRS